MAYLPSVVVLEMREASIGFVSKRYAAFFRDEFGPILFLGAKGEF